MKIWIDGFEANQPQRLGSGQIAFELLCNLEKIDRKNIYTVLIAGKLLDDLPKERAGWVYKEIKFNKFKTYLAIPLALFTSKNKPDIFFSPTHYGPFFAPCKRIILIFDLAFLKFKDMFKPRDLHQLILWTKISVKKASHIITISNNSKKDIQRAYGVKKGKITVAYPGYDKEKFKSQISNVKIEEIKKKYGIEGGYIIYIGTIQPRKNLVRLIETFSRIENNDLKLVIVGKTKGFGRQAWMFEETLNAPKKFGVEEKVIFTGFAPTEDLPYLLSGSKAYILPSLYEGFGIPVLEAMASGVPVLLSSVSSLPEVAGKAGIYFDPNSTTQIEHAIRLIISDSKIRQKYSKLGLAQVRKFSWKKMAREVLKTFEKVAPNP